MYLLRYKDSGTSNIYGKLPGLEKGCRFCVLLHKLIGACALLHILGQRKD